MAYASQYLGLRSAKNVVRRAYAPALPQAIIYLLQTWETMLPRKFIQSHLRMIPKTLQRIKIR
ncbi:hypothetical protein KJ835_00365, partial [Patescibacteria group bacterium]|nr:hypothetical protein [Patescibacteria group bacterium]